MTFEQITKDLKNKIYKPIYLLMGEEAYYIDKISNYIEQNTLSDTEKDFNLHIFYGKDSSVYTIDSTAKRFPMMAKYQLVIVKEAQNLKDIDKLVYYANKPLKSTILVLNYKYKSIAKNKKIYKEIAKTGIVFESKKLYDNQIPAWITKYLKVSNMSIEPVAAALLTEYLGTDLSKISNELDKLKISLKPGSKITNKDIEENIGISKDFNNFELQNAIIKKDVLKANRIINYFEQNQKSNPIILTINSLYYFFRKLLIYHFLQDKSQKNVAISLQVNPYFVKDYQFAAKRYNIRKVVDIISRLREYDMKSKGYNNVSAGPGDLLKELIFIIIH